MLMTRDLTSQRLYLCSVEWCTVASLITLVAKHCNKCSYQNWGGVAVFYQSTCVLWQCRGIAKEKK